MLLGWPEIRRPFKLERQDVLLFLGHTGATSAASIGFGLYEFKVFTGFVPKKASNSSSSDMMFALFSRHTGGERAASIGFRGYE